jgi:hypothetical protein
MTPNLVCLGPPKATNSSCIKENKQQINRKAKEYKRSK